MRACFLLAGANSSFDTHDQLTEHVHRACCGLSCSGPSGRQAWAQLPYKFEKCPFVSWPMKQPGKGASLFILQVLELLEHCKSLNAEVEDLQNETFSLRKKVGCA